MACLEPCVALAYSEPEHIQNTYLEPSETILFQCMEHHHQVFRKSRVSVSSVDNLVVPVEEHELCVKSVEIRSFLWSVFSPNEGKYGPEKTLYLGTFHAGKGTQVMILSGK